MAASRVERIRVTESRVPELASNILSSAIEESLRERGRVTLALAGGTTPRATYERLAQVPGIPWSDVHVYFGDERAVPPDHPDSNYRLAREALLDRVAIPPENVHRMRAEDPDKSGAAAAYEQELPEALDVLILGVGEDGHTASLFPGSPALREQERRVLPVTGPKPPFERLTLTPRVMEAARSTLVLAVGAGKADAVFRALEGPLDVDRCPAQLVRNAIWLTDHAAGAKLTGAWQRS